MKHAEVKDRLGPYLEGELPLQQRALVDAHLDACEPCAEELRELRAMIELLQALPEEAPPAGLADRVLTRVRAGEADLTLLGRALDAVDVLLRPSVLTPVLAGALGALAIVVLQRQPEPVAQVRTTVVAAPSPRAPLPTSLQGLRSGPPPFVFGVGPTGALELHGIPFRPPRLIGASADLELPGAGTVSDPRWRIRSRSAGAEQWADSVRDEALRYDLSNELDGSLRATGDRSAVPVEFSTGDASEDR